MNVLLLLSLLMFLVRVYAIRPSLSWLIVPITIIFTEYPAVLTSGIFFRH